MRRLTAELSRRRPDIIHFQWLTLPAVEAFYLAKLKAVAPLVFTLHNTTVFHASPASRVQSIGLRTALQQFSAVIVHTEYTKRKAVEKHWVPPDKLHVIPHGVFDHFHRLCPDPPATTTGDQQVLFFGTIKPYKGLDLLVRAFAALPAEVRATTRLIIAGLPQMDMTPVRKLARDLNINERITWHTRFIPPEEVPVLCRSASLMVLPYREIDQSGVLMTAIAFERPLIAARTGGVPETVKDGVHGILVQPGNIAELTAAMHGLLIDPGRRRSMQQELHSLRAGKLSWQNIAAQTLNLYEALATTSARQRHA
jgi:glycosyltransferase involved in cell wall biosynthesis